MTHLQVALGEIATLIRGITYKPSDVCEATTQSAVACMRTKNVQEDLDESDIVWIPASIIRNSSKYLNPGDILVSSANSWNLVGKGCWVPELKYPASAGGFISILRGNQDIVDLRYLYHWFVSPQTQAKLRSYSNKTTNISNLDHSRTLATEIPLPPLEEQRRIAAILDKAAWLATMCARLQATHRQVGESLFIDAFGDPRSNPLGLPSAMLGEIADCQLGKMLDKKRESGSSQKPYLRNANIRWFDVDVSDLLFMDIEDHEMDRFSVCAGDLLVCEGGEPGRAAIWRGDSGVFGLQKALHRIRPDKSWVLPEYLNWVLWILAQRGLLGDHITSATIAHLTREKLLKIRVLLPSLSAQERFARELGALDSLGLMGRSRSNLARSLNSSLFSALVATGIS